VRSAVWYRSMELITILHRCHRFQGFIYQHARYTPDKKTIEISVRPRKGSGRDLLALPSTGARLRPTRRTALRVHAPDKGLYAVPGSLGAPPPVSSNWPSTTHLGTYLSPKQPTISF
jgi:hypothetical protein